MNKMLIMRVFCCLANTAIRLSGYPPPLERISPAEDTPHFDVAPIAWAVVRYDYSLFRSIKSSRL